MASSSVPFVRPHAVRTRAVIGIAVAGDLSRVTGVLASTSGHGLAAQLEIQQAAAQTVSAAVAAQYRQIAQAGPASATLVPALACQLAEVQIGLVRRLVAAASAPEVLAIGVHDPGMWQIVGDRPQARIGLCDTARLAEATGIAVVDDFPARDLANGGRGGPIDALAQGMLLGHPQHHRLVVDLGRTSRTVYLPARSDSAGAERVIAHEVGPGMGLLDALTERLTEGKQSFDPGGRLAVQGQQIPELLEQWLDAACFRRPPPCWSPHGVAPDDFVDQAVHAAVGAGWSMRDLLCTATHLVAESVVRAVRAQVPPAASRTEIVLAGGGQQNGLLLREMARRLPSVAWIRADDAGVPSRQLDAAGVAGVTLLHLDHVPQTLTAITGTSAPRVLGRLTPGAPRQWQALIRQLYDSRPGTMPLRSAI